MSDKVAKAFEEFLRTRRDHRDGLSARQQLWTAFEAGAQFTLDEIRERTGLSAPTQETRSATCDQPLWEHQGVATSEKCHLPEGHEGPCDYS